ncbi:MAG: heat-inducible transcriptional repressor HrcA, partial [Desulfobulbia bacterium]
CIGVLGVIGPTRMNYADVINVVDMTSRLVSSVLTGHFSAADK